MNQLANYLEQDNIKMQMMQMLADNADSFKQNLLQAVSETPELQNINPVSVYQAALMANTLKLPISKNLGFAYIVPYKGQAQFQIGYKGYVQLAQKSGQFRRIGACAIYSGDDDNSVYQRMFGLTINEPMGHIVGYVGFFELHNGFQAVHKMSINEMQAHAKKYSQSFKNGKGVWASNFEEMAKKTVIKLLLSKQAPLSIDSQTTAIDHRAFVADQASIIDANATVVQYIDNDDSTNVGKLVTDEMFNNMLNCISQGYDKYGNPFDKASAYQFLEKGGYVLNHDQQQFFLSY